MYELFLFQLVSLIRLSRATNRAMTHAESSVHHSRVDRSRLKFYLWGVH